MTFLLNSLRNLNIFQELFIIQKPFIRGRIKKVTQTNKDDLPLEGNLPTKQLLLCEEGILKEICSPILYSKIGKFIFALVYDPISDSLGDCLIDLETEYSLGLVKTLIGETLKVYPCSNYLRLRAPEFQSLEVQELINTYLSSEVAETSETINPPPVQSDDYLENLIMSIAEQCNAKEIPAAIAIFLPNKKNQNI